MFGSGLDKAWKELVFKPMRKTFKDTYNTVNKVFSKPFIEDAKKLTKQLWHGPVRAFTEIGTILSGAGIAKIFQFANALGVFEPILDVLNGLLEILGAQIMEDLMPIFEELIETLMSKEFLDFIKLLAHTFSAVLLPVIQFISSFLKLITGQAMNTQEMGQAIGGAIGAIVGGILASYIGMPWLGALLGAAIGSMMGNIVGGMFMGEGGIVTGRRPTHIIAGEKREPEMIVPLSKADEMGFGGKSQGDIYISIDGGVFATDERELAKRMAKIIRLYNF